MYLNIKHIIIFLYLVYLNDYCHFYIHFIDFLFFIKKLCHYLIVMITQGQIKDLLHCNKISFVSNLYMKIGREIMNQYGL